MLILNANLLELFCNARCFTWVLLVLSGLYCLAFGCSVAMRAFTRTCRLLELFMCSCGWHYYTGLVAIDGSNPGS